MLIKVYGWNEPTITIKARLVGEKKTSSRRGELNESSSVHKI